MKIEVSVEVFRPAERVWSVLVDVERWPEWTASITQIERLDQAAFGPGSRVRIRQAEIKDNGLARLGVSPRPALHLGGAEPRSFDDCPPHHSTHRARLHRYPHD